MSNSAASRTKDLLIDVARQLFAKIGITNTTVNDIADKSQKGRRTIYTYFRNKGDIITAVIEKELQCMLTNLRQAQTSKLRPENKLMHFIYTHLETMKEIVNRNGSLKAEFFKDISRVEKARQSLDKEEHKMLKIILDEGVRAGYFYVPSTHIAATILLGSLKGMEVPYLVGKIKTSIGDDFDQFRYTVESMIFNGLRPKRRDR